MTAAAPLDLVTIGYSVLAERAGSIAFPPAEAGAEILVCVQGGPVTLPDAPPGVRVVPVAGRGVARSRNAAIDHATRPYLLFCDDDVRVDVDGVAAGVRHLRGTGRALALGRGVDDTGASRKRHPSSVRRLNLLNSGRAATYEMLVDLAQVRAGEVRFDERFGAGAPLHLADEYLFVADLLRVGLCGDAVPFVYGTHPAVSSGLRWGTPADGHARAVALNRVFGRWAPAARLAFAVRHGRRLGGLAATARFVTDATLPGPRAGTPAPAPSAAETPPPAPSAVVPPVAVVRR